jgi:hypothetical protein
MAKKRVKSEKQDAKDGGPIHQGGDVSQIKQPEKVHLGDTSALKRTLDDTVAEVSWHRLSICLKVKICVFLACERERDGRIDDRSLSCYCRPCARLDSE